MSVRLPSQKKFAPVRPKPGGARPGGPPKAPSAGFAQPVLPPALNAPVAAKSLPATATGPSGVTSTSSGDVVNNNASAEAGPSSRPHLSSMAASGSSSAIPSAQLMGLRRSVSPVKHPVSIPQSSTPDGASGHGLPPGIQRQRSKSPTATVHISLSPSKSPHQSNDATKHPPASSAARPVESPVAPTRPIPQISSRAPSSSPASASIMRPPPSNRPFSRTSESPAPSVSRQRSMSRQPSLTPSTRTGGRPSLIAAAENRTAPLKLNPSVKERRALEKKKAQEVLDAGKERQRFTPAPSPAPTPISFPGMPPMLASGPRDEEDVDMDDEESEPVVRAKETTQEIADRIIRNIGGPSLARKAGGRRGQTPLSLAEAEERDDASVRSVRDDEGTQNGMESGEEGEGDDDEVIEPRRKKARKNASQGKNGKSRPKSDPQRRRYNQIMKARATSELSGIQEEGDKEEGDKEEDIEEDADLNELDISDDGSMALKGPRDRNGGSKRKRRAPRSPVFQPVDLDEVGVGELIGEEIDEDNIQMGDLATKRSGEGKVSSRGKHVWNYLREQHKKNKARLDSESISRYEKRQVLRRQVRLVRNMKREQRRDILRDEGGDPDEVSEDEPDSDVDFEIKPDRLTPELTPEPGARNPEEEVEDEPEIGSDEEEAIIEEVDYAGIEQPPGIDAEEDEDAPGEEEEEDPEEEVSDPYAPKPDDEDARHEFEEGEEGYIDPELAALGFTAGGRVDNHEPEEDETLDDLVARTHAERDSLRNRMDMRVAVEEEDTSKMPNIRSYAKRVNNEKWTSEETDFFYSVLGEMGENYTMMALYFPNRTQRQLKNKGKKENMINPDRVNEAIRSRRPIDPSYLQKVVGFDPDGPTEKADQLIEETRDLPARWTREDTDRVLADVPEGEEAEEGEEVVEDAVQDVETGGADEKDDDEPEEEEEEDDEGDKEEDGEDYEDEQDVTGGY